jgi:guanylate kinase
MKRGLIFVVSAPAGTGKTTLVRMLTSELSRVVESVSFTTRAPRALEVPGRDYHFVSVPEFESRLKEGEFLEHAKVFDSYYGTSRKLVEKQLAAGKHIVLIIDTQGALQLKGKIEAVFIFISPPNPDELRKRLSARSSESPAAIEQRLSWAAKEMALIASYDYHIVNEELDMAYLALKSIVIAEEHRIQRKHS